MFIRVPESWGFKNSFNRTIVGLKLLRRAGGPPDGSNSFNRTIVGLKLNILSNKSGVTFVLIELL